MPKKTSPKQEIITESHISLPPNQAAGMWDIDPERLAEFCNAFGIKRRITFRWSGGKYRRGTHYSRRNGDGTFRHHIVLNQYRDPDSARRTLLHELAHAIQDERFNTPSEFHKEYTSYNHSGRHYQSENPFEIEAVEFAANNFDAWGDIIY